VPELFNGCALRHTYAGAEEHNLDVYHYMEESFGNVPIVILLGDFLQLRPPRRRSLCERPIAYKDRRRKNDRD